MEKVEPLEWTVYIYLKCESLWKKEEPRVLTSKWEPTPSPETCIEGEWARHPCCEIIYPPSTWSEEAHGSQAFWDETQLMDSFLTAEFKGNWPRNVNVEDLVGLTEVVVCDSL